MDASLRTFWRNPSAGIMLKKMENQPDKTKLKGS
jgi:hypothetical protein